jgi:sarcosine oxidase
VTDDEVDECRRVLNRYVPGSAGAAIHTLTCMYTDTPDLQFVIDVLPDDPNVVVGCGCSGHAFKFTPVLGEILADLAIDGHTEHGIGHLSAARFN